MENEKFSQMPFPAILSSILKNQMRYFKKNCKDFNILSQGLYLIKIHKYNMSQEDLVEHFAQTKGTVAKSLKKLEEDGYIERQIDPTNRRKYILKVTQKGEDMVPIVIENIKQWELKVGITDLDEKTKEKIREIALKSALILED